MNRIPAGTYEFSHHNIFIPEHITTMLEKEVAENKNYRSTTQWLTHKYKGDWSIQAMKQIVNGNTKSPSIDLLEDMRRLVTKTGVAAKFPHPQLPIIRISEVQRIIREDSGLRYNTVAERLGVHSATLSNVINEKVQYRYDIAWKLTHYFIKYFEHPDKYREKVTWDFYGWVQERRAEEGIMTQEEHAKWRDQYNRRMGGGSYYVKKT